VVKVPVIATCSPARAAIAAARSWSQVTRGVQPVVAAITAAAGRAQPLTLPASSPRVKYRWKPRNTISGMTIARNPAGASSSWCEP